MNMSPAYAVFLVAAAVCAVFICVAYLKLQSDIVNRSENISALQEKLADLTDENDTAYNAAADSVNLEEIRSKAMNEMGMVYAAQGNVVEYESPTSDYVKQYNDIPSDGVLAEIQRRIRLRITTMAKRKRKNRFQFLTKKFPKRMQKKLVMLFMAIILAFIVLVGRITYIMPLRGINIPRLYLTSRSMTAE